MKKPLPLILLSVLLPACDDRAYDTMCFLNVLEFPVAGQVLSWEYLNEDNPEDPPLRVTWTMAPPVYGWETGAFTYQVGEEKEAVLLWSAQLHDQRGIRVHGYWEKGQQEMAVWSPPIDVVDICPWPGDQLSTATGGTTWSSEYLEVTGCGTWYQPMWSEVSCHHVVLDDGDQDPGTNGWLTGDYWLVQTYGIARMRLDAIPGTWSLSSVEKSELWWD